MPSAQTSDALMSWQSPVPPSVQSGKQISS
jgi:hypothetical protein